MVIWLIGMSASGKTTIGRKLFDKLTLSDEKWIFLDGDTFRNILGEDLGHTIEDRRKNAYRISRFCDFLSSQGINVLACVLSIFHDNQKYNKENIKNYKEIYIDVEFEKLIQRDNKELYKKAMNGEISDVVGVDIEFNPPYAPDLIIDNNIENPDYNLIINKVVKELKIEIQDDYLYTQNNLLEFPHKYQYSKFEGEEFFLKFKEDRNSTLIFLEKRIEHLSKSDIHKKATFSKKYKNGDNIILKYYLKFLLDCSPNELLEQKSILNLLIKRFEVGKKLYLTYDSKEIRKSSIFYKEYILYPMFSLVLQKYYYSSLCDEEKLIYFNALLKVNDIISSTKMLMITPSELDFCKLAFQGELKIVKEYKC